MPNIYDIAGGQGMQFAQPFSAMQQARQNKAATRLTEAQALVMETNVANDARDYALEDRKVKVSEGGLDVARERNVIDANEFGLKYEQWREKMFNGMSEDGKRAHEFFEKAQETGIELYEQALEQGASEEEATQLANAPFAYMQNQMPGNMRGKALFDPNLGAAVRTRNNRASNTVTSKQLVVSLPGRAPAEMEVYRIGDKSYIKDEKGNLTVLSSDQMSSPTQRVENSNLELSKPEIANLRQSQTAGLNFVDGINDAFDILENVDANTLTARGVGIAQDAAHEALALVRAMGVKVTASENPGDYEGLFKDANLTGEANARMRGLITSLAFQAALSYGSTGRDVSNQDVEKHIRELGANRSDPAVFKRLLVDNAIRIERKFRNRWEVAAQGDPALGEYPQAMSKRVEAIKQRAGLAGIKVGDDRLNELIDIIGSGKATPQMYQEYYDLAGLGNK
jgi:hypothetical protein